MARWRVAGPCPRPGASVQCAPGSPQPPPHPGVFNVAQANEASAVSPEEAVLEAENFIETYKIIADWIRFADTKAAATLTVNGVLLGLLIPTLRPYLTEKGVIHPTEWWPAAVVALFLCWLVLLVLSAF